MSVVAAHHPASRMPSGRPPSRVLPPRLVLAGPGAPERREHPRPALRARLAIAVLAGLVLVVLAATFALGAGGSPAGVPVFVTVEPGQSLSQIAAEHLPGVPVREAVVDLQLLNGLNSTDVVAGQQLRLPALAR